MVIKTFDVVIPVYRPGHNFKKLLDAIHQQTRKPNKIILMFTCTEEESLPIAKRYQDIEVHRLSKTEFDHGGTRKKAATYSDAEAMVYMTQDALPQDDMLFEELLKPFEDDEVGVTYARQLPRKSCSTTEKFIRSFNYPAEDRKKTKADLSKLGIKTFFCSDVCAAYRKDRYEELGGFSEPLIFNEDMILASRFIYAGYAVYYAANAIVVHSHRYSNLQQFRRNFDLGVSQADYPEIFAEVKSESEGKKMVKQTLRYLAETNRLFLVPSFLLTCAMKYAGYWFGKHYYRLSNRTIKRFTTSPEYWDK